MTMSYEKMYLVSEPEYLKACNVEPADRTAEIAPPPEDDDDDDDMFAFYQGGERLPPMRPQPVRDYTGQYQAIPINDLKNNILKIIIRRNYNDNAELAQQDIQRHEHLWNDDAAKHAAFDLQALRRQV